MRLLFFLRPKIPPYGRSYTEESLCVTFSVSCRNHPVCYPLAAALALATKVSVSMATSPPSAIR